MCIRDRLLQSVETRCQDNQPPAVPTLMLNTPAPMANNTLGPEQDINDMLPAAEVHLAGQAQVMHHLAQVLSGMFGSPVRLSQDLQDAVNARITNSCEALSEPPPGWYL
eukprot:TRINITY_DN19624_c0_g1_i2.p1 TRINITY_DN19624_c0_g1~~TRINITY_DN19624_c0_g1_i2.p1  ORF type:complete len:109 (-),score=28.09 TRINITY_DN19624_c0_g1_i2:253-579(-)